MFVAFVDATRHRQLADEAVDVARRSGDTAALAAALHARATATDTTDLQEVQSYSAEVVRLAVESGDLDLEGATRNSLAIAAWLTGDRAAVDRELAELTRLADVSRSPFARYLDLIGRANLATVEGRYADADRLVGEALTAARRTGDRVNVSAAGSVWFPLLREQGRSSDIERATRRMVDAQPLVTSWRSGLMQALVDQGKLDEAAEHVEFLARDGCAAVADDVMLRYTLGAMAEVTSAVGDAGLASTLYDRLLPSAGAAALIGNGAYHGAVDRYLGLLATTVAEFDVAIAHHEHAMAIHERMRARPWVARSKYDLACTLLARSASGDRERALVLLNDALDAANTIGQTKLVQEVLTAKLGLQGISSGSSVMLSIDAVAAGVSIDRPDLRRHAASDGTVTVLFSDIESYTQLNERLGDARTQRLLRAHDAIVRDATTAHGGTVVKSQGDGYMLVFANPVNALASAVTMQRTNDAHDYGADAGSVRVRIGLHTGEVIREGDDFFGRTVILAARIAAQAGGGEILVSEQLRPAATDETHGGKLGSAREVALKGFSGTHRVHVVEW
jgi:class 3 adenylate cyclase